MITQTEFMKIVEEHLKLNGKGSIVIDDPKLSEAFINYLKHFAKASRGAGGTDPNGFLDINYKCHSAE